MADPTLEQILSNPEGLSGAASMLQGASPGQRRRVAGDFFKRAMPFFTPPGVQEAMDLEMGGEEPTMRELMMLGVLGPIGKAKKGLRLIQGGKTGPRKFEDEAALAARKAEVRDLGGLPSAEGTPASREFKQMMDQPQRRGKTFDEVIASERGKPFADQGIQRLELDPKDAVRGAIFKPGTIVMDRNTGKVSTILAKGPAQEKAAAKLLSRRILRGEPGQGDLGKALGTAAHTALRKATDMFKNKHLSEGEYIAVIRDLLSRGNIRGFRE
jgi:hypothetical protein